MFEVDEKEVEAVARVIKSMKYFRYQGGDNKSVTQMCEDDFKSYLDCSYNLLTTSGTNSLVVGMSGFGLGVGDEVIIPSYTFVATASAIMQVGAIPVISNINEKLSLDVEDVKNKITDKTKAIVLVHMDGLIADVEGIRNLAQEKELLFIEDAAQAIGGEFAGQKVGTLSDFGAYSFNVDKVISCGEGGLLIVKDKKYEKEFLKSFGDHDTASQFGLSMKERLKETSGHFGISSRMNDINAAMLQVQLKKLPQILLGLRHQKNKWVQRLQEHGLELRLGHDLAGDVGSSLHIKVQDPLQGVEKMKKLLAKGFKIMPPTFKPAHACYQWMHAMSKDAYYSNQLNPYLLTDKEYEYKKSDFLSTIQILGTTLKMEMPRFENEEKTDSDIEDFLRAYDS